MENPITFLLILFILIELVLFLSMTLQFLISPKRFVEKVFSRERPSLSVSGERSTDASDWIVLYYGARVFVVGIPGLIILLTLHKVGIH